MKLKILLFGLFFLLPFSAYADTVTMHYASSTSAASVSVTTTASTTLFVHAVIGNSGNGFNGNNILYQDSSAVETMYIRQVGTGAQTTDNADIQYVVTPGAGTHTYTISGPSVDYSSVAVIAVEPGSSGGSGSTSSSTAYNGPTQGDTLFMGSVAIGLLGMIAFKGLRFV